MKQDKIVTTNSSTENQGKTHVQWLIAILVNGAVLSYGFQTGWVACMAKLLQSKDSPTGYPLSTVEISWLASSPSLAAMLGIPMWTILVDKFGRKHCVIGCAVFQMISWIIKICFVNMTGLMIARIIGGIAGGGCVYVIPMYIKEISQDDIRGILGMILNLARNLGILAIYLMGGYLEYYTVLWIALTLSVINIVTMIKAPESPTFYVKMGKFDEAASTVAFLRKLSVDNKVVQNAIDSIRAEDAKFKSIPNISFAGILKQKAWRKGFIFMILVMICHSLNGGFAIVNYAQTILETMGVTVSPELQSLSIPIFMIVGSLLSMVFIESLGRKPILMMSFLLAMLSFAALAAIFIIQQQGGYVPSWLSVVMVVIPVCTYAAAVSPMPFVLMAEMFNFQIRAKIMGCLVMLGWSGAFVQLLVFGPLSTTFGSHVTFIALAIINLFGTLVVLIFLPETKGKSVEQIELELEKKLNRK